MTRRPWVWVVQGVLLAAVGLFVWRSLSQNWAAFRAIDLDLRLRPGPLAMSVLTVAATYALLIEAWRRVLAGWGIRLGYGRGARIWVLSNLGRYLPGKLWSVAGLAVLARRAGIPGWSAAAAAVAMQALAVGPGALVAGIWAPGVAAPVVLGAVAVGALAAFAGLTWPPVTGWVERRLGAAVQLRPVPVATAAWAALAALASWLGYGLAFWFLAVGMLPAAAMPLGSAVGAFAGGYIVGLLALFAPGGVGVREVVLVTLLAPVTGSGGAVAVTVGSRLLLTLVELGAAAVVAWGVRDLAVTKEPDDRQREGGERP